jgi:hypothetical protein
MPMVNAKVDQHDDDQSDRRAVFPRSVKLIHWLIS